MKIKAEDIKYLFINFDITKILFNIDDCAFYEDFFVESLQDHPDQKKLEQYEQFGCITTDNIILVPCAFRFSIRPSKEDNEFCCLNHNVYIEVSDQYYKIPDIHLELSDIGKQYKVDIKSDNVLKLLKAYCSSKNLKFD